MPTPVPLAVLLAGRIKTAVILVVPRVLRDHQPRAGGQAQPAAEEDQWQQHLTPLFTFLSLCVLCVRLLLVSAGDKEK